MKKEDLLQQGLTEEQITFVFAENGKDINSAKTALEEERNNLQSQLNSAQETLKTFEGVNPTELNEKITQLNTQLEQQKTEYENQIKERDFSMKLDQKITALGGKNATAIKALITNIDKLKASQNQDADIDSALANIQKDNDYLFESKEPIKNPVQPNGNTNPKNGASVELAKKIMGLDTQKKG